jgi:hypothetical protein
VVVVVVVGGGSGGAHGDGSSDYDNDEINKHKFISVQFVKDKFYYGCTEGTDHDVLFI